MKTGTIRMEESLWEDLQKLAAEAGESVNSIINKNLEDFRLIRTNAMNELKGIFSVSEWKFLADSLQSSRIIGPLRLNKGALIAHCEDAAKFEGMAEKWNINLSSLIGEINKLKGANIDAIYKRIENYWDVPQEMDKWAEF